ncbi:hypothetical protein CALVIDRAFT_558872 [Calocera viscosa TUFC12733]|uniref:Lytic polysaccharide monooxygenase n=1 Tax=Calocera viscosa (strain TUFC12733) TaxID=1330018 RepID=A0A167G224_CALVF|nr:hypothetical protein CALVIDRAFT_558872 [Calocera viscosa TUFC12733]
MADVVLLFLLLFALCAPRAFGQDSACTAIPTLFNNDRGESPCQVFSDLMTAPQCSGISNVGAVTVAPDPEATATVLAGYESAPNTVVCWCSTVTYYALSACSACQGLPWMSWDVYSERCSAGSVNVAVGYFPLPVPQNTSIPAWAMLEAVGNFSLSVAEDIASLSYPDTGPTVTLEVTIVPSSLSTTATSDSSSSAPSLTSSSHPPTPFSGPSYGSVTESSTFRFSTYDSGPGCGITGCSVPTGPATVLPTIGANSAAPPSLGPILGVLAVAAKKARGGQVQIVYQIDGFAHANPMALSRQRHTGL